MLLLMRTSKVAAGISPMTLLRHGKLKELHPTFAPRVARVIERLEARGFKPTIPRDSGWRTEADQKRIKKAGHSEVDFSFHMETDSEGNPAALAVDIVDKRWAWKGGTAAKRMTFWTALEEEAKAEGMITGRHWSKWDPAHVQPWTASSGMLARTANPAWTPDAGDFAPIALV